MIPADKTLRLEIRFARLSTPVSLLWLQVIAVHEVISTPSHRHQSPRHLTLTRAGERPTTNSRAICGPEPERIQPLLGINAKRQSGSLFHVRVLHTAFRSGGSCTARWASTQPSLSVAHSPHVSMTGWLDRPDLTTHV